MAAKNTAAIGTVKKFDVIRRDKSQPEMVIRGTEKR